VDLPKEIKSGLSLVSDILMGIEGVSFVYLDVRDVVRHKIVQEIVEAYKEYESKGDDKPSGG
jgi:phosphate starvation-inducible PhoH-like protein